MTKLDKVMVAIFIFAVWFTIGYIIAENQTQTAYIVRVDKQLRSTMGQVDKLKAIDSLFLYEMKSIDSLHKSGVK